MYCFSVNDAFVMWKWGLDLGLPQVSIKHQFPQAAKGNFENVKLIPDGCVHFTKGMGMQTCWDKERGFGERSWRYAALVNDMKIEWIEVFARKLNSSG